MKDYWGKDLQRQCRPRQFRPSCATNISATPRSRWKPSRPTRSTGAPRTAPRTGPPPTTSPRSPTSAWCWKNFRSTTRGIMQAFAFNIRRAKFQDPRLRRAFNYAFDFEEMNKQIFFGQYKRINSYFEGTELASSGLPRGRELEILETVRDKVPPEVFTEPYANPVNGNPEPCAIICARRCGCSSEAGYEIHNQKLVNTKTGEPLYGRIPSRRSELRARRFVLQALARPARHRPYRCAPSTTRSTRTGCALGTSTSSPLLGQVAVARQRAARLLGLAGRRPAGLAQSDRHQEPGGRRHDRPDDLRQEPARSRRRHPRARPRTAVEPLRRAAMELRQNPQRPLGPLRPARADAEIRRPAFPTVWWWDAAKAAKAGGTS